MLVGAVAVAPAFAYPPGTALTVSCTPAVVTVNATTTCTATNVDQSQATTIVFGGLVAQGPTLGIVQASFIVAQDDGASVTETLGAPSTAGTYEVVATNGSETATTTVQVVDADGGKGDGDDDGDGDGSGGGSGGGTDSGSGSGGTDTGGGATTPDTGANVALGLVAGLAALGIGGGLVAASRRKNI